MQFPIVPFKGKKYEIAKSYFVWNDLNDRIWFPQFRYEDEFLSACRPVGDKPQFHFLRRVKQTFPIEVVPDELKLHAHNLSMEYNVPISSSVFVLLGFVAAVIGATKQIQVKKNWREYANIWPLFVAPRGSGKSPLLKFIIQPFYDLQAEIVNHEHAAGQRENWKRVVTQNFTLVALEKMLANNPRGLLVHLDEMYAFFKALYDADKLSAVLRMYDAAPLSHDKCYGNAIHTKGVPLTIIGGVQTQVFESEIFPKKDFEIAGLLDRFIFLPEEFVKPMYSSTTEYLDETKSFLHNFVDYFFTEFGEEDVPEVYLLSDEAHAYYDAWRNYHAALFSQTPYMPRISKAFAQGLRISLILHTLNIFYTKKEILYISLETLTRALGLTEWIISTYVFFHNKLHGINKTYVVKETVQREEFLATVKNYARKGSKYYKISKDVLKRHLLHFSEAQIDRLAGLCGMLKCNGCRNEDGTSSNTRGYIVPDEIMAAN